MQLMLMLINADAAADGDTTNDNLLVNIYIRGLHEGDSTMPVICVICP